MAQKNPLVLQNGRLSQLPPGGTISGYTLSTVTAGSGLVGGGDLNTGNIQLDVALATNPSGLIFVGDSIGNDGLDLATANSALASGNTALSLYPTVNASGTAYQSYANAALVSGNTALSAAVNAALYSNAVSLTAAATVSGGSPVGVDDTGRVVPLRVQTSGSFNPPSFGPNEIIYNSSTSVEGVESAYDPLSNRVYHAINTSSANRRSFVYQTEIFQNTSLYSSVSGVVTSGGAIKISLAAAPEIGYLGATYYDSTIGRTIFNLAAYSGGDYQWQTRFTADNRYTMFGTGTGTLNKVLYVAQDNTFVVACVSGNRAQTLPVKVVDGQPVRGYSSVAPATATVTSLGVANNTVQDRLGYFYNDSTTGGIGVVGTISGDSILIGSQTTFTSGTTNVGEIDATYSERDNVFIIAYRNNTTTRGSYNLSSLTTSGTSLIHSFTQPQVFESGNTNYIKVLYEGVNNKVIVAYQNASNSNYGTTRVGQISGNFINFDTSVVFRSAAVSWIAGAYDSKHNNVTLNYLNTANSRVETVVFNHLIDYSYNPVRSGVANYLGVAQSTVSSGSPVTVVLPHSIAYTQPNLTVGRDYYLDYYSGGFTLASGVPPTWSGGSIWAPVGKAISSSGLYLLKAI